MTGTQSFRDTVSDRLELLDLTARYSNAIDRREFDALDGLFTADARIDYTEMGGIEGDLASVKVFLSDAFANFTRALHLMGLPVIDIDGDSAHSVTPCNNPMVFSDEQLGLMLCGLWYHLDFVRTPAGWRISHMREERCYMKTFPKKTPKE